MELVRWRPRRDVLSVHDELDRAMDRLLRTWMPVESYSGLDWNPRVDIAESDDRFVVKAEIPGVEMGDIDISLVDGNLVIQGEKKQPHKIDASKCVKCGACYDVCPVKINIPEILVHLQETYFTSAVLLTPEAPGSSMEPSALSLNRSTCTCVSLKARRFRVSFRI